MSMNISGSRFLAARSFRDLTTRQMMGILGTPNLLYRILIARCGLPAIYRYGELFFMAEQLPNPESRITLSRSTRDAFGYPIASIHWKPAVNDFSSLEEFTRTAFGKGLQSSQYRMAREGTIDNWIKNFTSAAHHVGTVRMASTSTTGAVDSQLAGLWGKESTMSDDGSVFPTAGSANPSLTITALGIRHGGSPASEV